MVGLVLFGLGGVAAIIEGVTRLRHPHDELGNLAIAIGLLVVAAVAEGYSLRTGLAEARPLKGDRSWIAHLRRTKDPDTTVVIVEDTGALVGLGMALVGIVVTAITGDPRWDAGATLGIGVLLCAMAAFLTSEMRSLLVGEPAVAHLRARIREVAMAQPGVVDVTELRTEHLGPDELLVCVRVVVTGGQSNDAAIAERTRRAIEDTVPSWSLCYVQPHRNASTDP